jgi:hypothetical protein
MEQDLGTEVRDGEVCVFAVIDEEAEIENMIDARIEEMEQSGNHIPLEQQREIYRSLKPVLTELRNLGL